MEIHEAAQALDGAQYRDEGSKELFESMAEARLVAVFGASDDLMEFRGAIYDELGAPGDAFVTSGGLLTNDCDEEDCPYFAKAQEQASEIRAQWCPEAEDGAPEWCWTYTTQIPHATFRIWEDGEPYCRGIVFSLDDVPMFGGAGS